MRVLILVALLAAAAPSFAEPVWTWRNPLPQGGTLYDAHFVDPTTGYAVGELGALVRTDDGGLTWSSLPTGAVGTLTSVHFIDTTTGLVSGVRPGGTPGFLLRTTDGGLNWQDVTPAGADWLDAVAVGPGGFGLAVGRYGGVWRSADAGSSWLSGESGTTSWLKDVAISGMGTAVAVSTNGDILRSQDSGATWQAMPSGTTDRLESVAFADSLNGLAAGWRGTVRITQDGGINWWARTATGADYNNVAMHGSTALLAGEAGGLLLSTDYGLHWAPLVSPTTQILYGTSAGPAGLVAVGGYGEIWCSNDSGATWQAGRTGPGERFWKVALAGDRSLAVGEAGIILRSGDRGLSWTEVGAGPDELMGIAMAGPDTAVAVGADGTVLGSVDGGLTWTPRASGTTETLWAVDLADGRHGTAAGAAGTIIRTDDGGLTWSPQTSGVGTLIQAVVHTGRDTAMVATFYGEILRTDDGGHIWVEVFNQGYFDLQGLSFPDPVHGFAVGGIDGPGLVTTGDGGLTWQAHPTALQGVYAYDTAFRDEHHGLVAATSGVWVTVDGGDTWLPQTCPADRLWGIALTPDGIALAVGNGGAILRTEQADWPSGVAEPPGKVAVVALGPAVPNPFNPRTVLGYEIAVTGPVWLTVHDLRGRLVRSLVAGAVRSQGSHRETWDGRDGDGRDVAAGVYLVRVRAGGGVASGRIVLIR